MDIDALGTTSWTLCVIGPGDAQILDLSPAGDGAVLITGHMERQHRSSGTASPNRPAPS